MAPAIDDKREQLRDAALESTTLRLAFVGLASDLLETLEAEQPLEPTRLSEKTDADSTYVARWLDAAHGFELVEEDGGAFELTELGRSFLPDAPGTMMPLAVQSILSARMADRLSELVRSGEQPGDELLEDFENVTPWFGRMLEAKFRPYFREHVLPAVDIFEELDAARGRVLDLGTGNGWYLRELLGVYGGLTGVGVDAIAENIDDAERAKAETDLGDRLDLRRADLFEFRPEEPFDAVVLNRTLHHVWDRRDDLFETLDAALGEEGALIVWEPAWPESRTTLRDPERRILGMRNLAEHAMGNRLLVPDDICRTLESHGFDVEVQRLDPVETLFVARTG